MHTSTPSAPKRTKNSCNALKAHAPVLIVGVGSPFKLGFFSQEISRGVLDFWMLASLLFSAWRGLLLFVVAVVDGVVCLFVSWGWVGGCLVGWLVG